VPLVPELAHAPEQHAGSLEHPDPLAAQTGPLSVVPASGGQQFASLWPQLFKHGPLQDPLGWQHALAEHTSPVAQAQACATPQLSVTVTAQRSPHGLDAGTQQEELGVHS
jgi:hypothetical protein